MPRTQDRVEVSLEGRQIAGVVAGSLVTLALVFAVGVGFGRQLALAPAPTTPAQSDLAHLDARPTTPAVQDTGFTFHEALVKGDQTVVAARPPPPPPPAPTPVPAPVAQLPVPAAAPEPAKAQAVPALAPPAAAEAKGAEVKAAVATPEAKAEVKEAKAAPASAAKAEKPAEQAVAKAEEKPAAKAEEKAKKEEPATWCVQFGASPARAEADKLAATLLDYGYTSYVVVADLPGKGRFYRVRVGHFAGKDQAEKLRVDASGKHKLAGVVMPAR